MLFIIKQSGYLFTALLLLATLGGCSSDPEDPKSQIKKVIEQIEVAAEKSSVKLFSEHVSSQYQDKRHKNRQQAMRLLLGYFHRNKNIHLFTRIRNIEISEQTPDVAKASVNVAMTGTQVDSSEQLMLLKARAYQFDVVLHKEDDQWLVRSAAWQRIQAKEFID